MLYLSTLRIHSCKMLPKRLTPNLVWLAEYLAAHNELGKAERVRSRYCLTPAWHGTIG